MMNYFKLCASALLLSAAVLSCQKEPEPIKVTGISINPTTLTLTEGDTQTLTASITPSNADVQGVSWSTNNSSVATVDNGKVTAIKAGSATITVTSIDGGKTATCEVTVNAKIISVESVTLDKSSLELTEGDKATLVATVKPENATNKNVTWSSSDESVATVSNGEVTAVKAGTAKITVKTEDGAKTAECSVTIKAKTISVEEVVLDKSANTLMVGETFTLTATVKPEDATNKNVTWNSSDINVATVEGGTVTAKAEGTTTITVTTEDGSKTATCVVTVSNDITKFVSASYLGGSMSIINGLIQYGSRVNFGINNNSPKTIHVVSIQLIDGETSAEGNVMPIDTDLEAYKSTGWSITIGIAGIHKPIAKIVYSYEGVEHSVQAQYQEIHF